MKVTKLIDEKEYSLFGPNAVLVKWLDESAFGRKISVSTGLNEQMLFKALSKLNPEEHAIEAKNAIRGIWYSYPEFGPYPFLDTLSEIFVTAHLALRDKLE